MINEGPLVSSSVLPENECFLPAGLLTLLLKLAQTFRLSSIWIFLFGSVSWWWMGKIVTLHLQVPKWTTLYHWGIYTVVRCVLGITLISDRVAGIRPPQTININTEYIPQEYSVCFFLKVSPSQLEPDLFIHFKKRLSRNLCSWTRTEWKRLCVIRVQAKHFSKCLPASGSANFDGGWREQSLRLNKSCNYCHLC